MRALSVIVSVLLAGSAYAQGSAVVVTPTGRDLSVPTYINATVTRVDPRRNTIGFRSDSGEVSLTAEGAALRSLGRLRPGDQVMLGYRTDHRSGRAVQIVTAILAGTQMTSRGLVSGGGTVSTLATVAPAEPAGFSTVTGRVVRVDPASGTLLLADADGRTETLSLQGAAVLSALSGILPGDQVDVAFTPGAANVGVTGVGVFPTSNGVFGTVNAIQPATAPTFVTGRVVTVDPTTGAATLRTPFGDQIFTLPATTSTVRPSDLRVGQDVRLGLSGRRGDRSFVNVTTIGSARTVGAVPGTSAGVVTPARTMGSTSFGTFATPRAAARTGAFTTVGSGGRESVPRGTVSTGVVAGSAVRSSSGTLTTIPGSTGIVSGGAVVGGSAVVPGSTVVPGTTVIPGSAGSVVSGAAGSIPGSNAANVAGTGTIPNRLVSAPSTGGGAFSGPLGTLSNSNTPLAGTPGTSGMAAGTADIGLSGGGGTISFPASPFAAVIPSLPSVVGQLNVVPPPQMAPSLPDAMPVGAAREWATRDYDSGVRMMALKANEIDMHWFRYRDGCLRTASVSSDIDRNLYAPGRDRQWFLLFSGDVRTPVDDNCRQLIVEMTRMANDWKDTMTRMEETARKNDVMPGAMREVRQRYRVEF